MRYLTALLLVGLVAIGAVRQVLAVKPGAKRLPRRRRWLRQPNRSKAMSQ